MPALSTIAIFLLAGLGILLIPGPSVLYVVTRSAAQGRRAGLASLLGIESATCMHIIAAALGLSAILLTSAPAFNVSIPKQRSSSMPFCHSLSTRDVGPLLDKSSYWACCSR